jgi:hypothetical protein
VARVTSSITGRPTGGGERGEDAVRRLGADQCETEKRDRRRDGPRHAIFSIASREIARKSAYFAYRRSRDLPREASGKPPARFPGRDSTRESAFQRV